MNINENIECVNQAIAYVIMMDDCGTFQEQIDCMKILCDLREKLSDNTVKCSHIKIMGDDLRRR